MGQIPELLAPRREPRRAGRRLAGGHLRTDDSPPVLAANAVFITLEEYTGHSPALLWSAVFEQYRFEIRAPALMVHGRVSRHQDVMNVVNRIRRGRLSYALPPWRSWR